jgi:flagellar motor switch protein FliM
MSIDNAISQIKIKLDLFLSELELNAEELLNLRPGDEITFKIPETWQVELRCKSIKLLPCSAKVEKEVLILTINSCNEFPPSYE